MFHCGMCEFDWRAAGAAICPRCGSDEIEPADGAIGHALAERRYSDAARIADHVDGFDRDDLGESPDF